MIGVAGAVAALGAAAAASGATPRQILGSLSAVGGLYANVIQNAVFTQAVTEVCYVGGVRLFDLHPAGGDTIGGNCLVGDTGFVIETVERTATTWDVAMETCIMAGMRLAQPVEYMVACRNAAALGVGDMGEDHEWVGNVMHSDSSATLLGSGSCNGLTSGAYITGSFPFRCVQ